MDIREQTFGELTVRASFNPSQDSQVDAIKQKAADLIDACHALRQGANGDAAVVRLASLAITEAEIACMWAVKAATA